MTTQTQTMPAARFMVERYFDIEDRECRVFQIGAERQTWRNQIEGWVRIL